MKISYQNVKALSVFVEGFFCICLAFLQHMQASKLRRSFEQIKKRSNMNSKFWISVGALSLVFAFAGCSKDPLAELTQEESRIYITNYDASANFSTFKTFSISDSAAVINNGQSTKQATSVDLAFIDAVKKQMESRGYVLVDRKSNPDLAVNVSRIYNTSTGIIRYTDYYNFYGSSWDPFYYGYAGYGYYSPYSYASYSIKEGALSVDLLDLKNAASNNRINVVFTGLIRGSGIFNNTTAASQVKLLFDAAAYLKTNN